MADLLHAILAEETLDQATVVAQLPKRVAQAVLARLRQLIPCQRASVVLFDFQTRESLLLAVDPTGETSLTAGSRLPFAAPNLTASRINLDTFRQGQLQEIVDTLSVADLSSIMLALSADGIRSYINVPLLVQEELIGTINLARETPGTFSPEHKENIREVAVSLAVALQQAQSYERARRTAEELCQRIAERAAALQKAHAAAKTFSPTLPHDQRTTLQQEATKQGDIPKFSQIESPRLRLRHFNDADFPTLFAYRNDPDVAKYQGWQSLNETEGRAFIAEQKSHQPGVPGQWFQFAIELKATGVHIGDVGLKVSEYEVHQAEIGYTLACAYQGRGFASEAVAGVLRYAFATLGLHRIIANTDCENVASIALLERLGMRREGHFVQSEWYKGKWADNYQYAMLKDDWVRLHGKQGES